MVLNDCFKSAKVCRSRKGFPSLPSRRPPQDRRTLPRRWTWRPFFDFFRFFSNAKNRQKNGTSKIHFFCYFWRFWVAPARIFSNFLSQNRSPEATFSVFFLKTVILSKSCSRCGGSTILKGQTLRKSIRRATPNGTGEKNRQQSLPAPSPGALFRSRARFFVDFGVPAGSQNRPKAAP